MPPGPPARKVDADYHFHTYDYHGSAPFTAVAIPDAPGNPMLYSLVQDLNGLLQEGQRRQVPGITLAPAGSPTAGGALRRTRVLSLGPAPGTANAPTVVFTGGIHAREWISPEMAYLLAEYLIINYKTGPLQNLTKYQLAIRRLIDMRRIHIIPMLNPDGIWFTVWGKDPSRDPRLWRKNCRVLPTTAQDWLDQVAPGGVPNRPFANVKGPSSDRPWDSVKYDVPTYDPPPTVETQLSLEVNEIGVDLNRNYTTRYWGYDCLVEPPSGGNPTRICYNPMFDSYFGPAAGSEVETRNIQTFLAGAPRLAAAIDYHSYGQCILYPTEAYDGGKVDTAYRRLGEVLHALVKSQGGQSYALGTPKQAIGYDATGTVIDYMAQQCRARAFCIELDPADKDPGFQLPETQIRTVFEKNIRGALAVIAAPHPAATKLGSWKRRATISYSEQQLLSWHVYGRGNQLPA